MYRGKSIDIPQADPLVVSVREAVQRHNLFSNRSLAVAAGHISNAPTDKEAQSTSLAHNDSDETRSPVIVGVSGGADSICLMYVLAQLRSTWDLDLHIAHFNHSLRPESGQDAAFVAQVASNLGMPFHTATASQGQLTHTALGVEGAARLFRYRFLIAAARSVTPPHLQPIIAVAHHADDQTETILMNLIRGSGLRGLSGMEWRAHWITGSSVCHQDERSGEQAQIHEVAIIRPLLGLQREEIVDFLHRYNIPWMEDISNQDPSLLRNRLRHEIFPILREINPNLTATISRTGETVRAELHRAQEQDQLAYAETQISQADVSQGQPTVRVVFDLRRLLAQDVATQRNIIRLALASVADACKDSARTSHQPTYEGLRRFGFDLIESVLEAIQLHTPPGVTHPIAQEIGWTIGSLLGDPPLLSIHCMDCLPFLPDHPLLDQSWKRRHGSIGMPVSHPLICPHGWTLSSEIRSYTDLPSNWLEMKEDWEAYIDASTVDELYLVTPPSGARFAPLGLNGKHQSLANLFTNRKVLKPFRGLWPTIVSRQAAEDKAGRTEVDQSVIWVCGLQLAESARLTQKTECVIHLRWYKTENNE